MEKPGSPEPPGQLITADMAAIRSPFPAPIPPTPIARRCGADPAGRLTRPVARSPGVPGPAETVRRAGRRLHVGLLIGVYFDASFVIKTLCEQIFRPQPPFFAET